MYAIYFNQENDVFVALTESEARSPFYKGYTFYLGYFDTEDEAFDALGNDDDIQEDSVYDFLENVVPILPTEEKNRILDNL